MLIDRKHGIRPQPASASVLLHDKQKLATLAYFRDLAETVPVERQYM